MNSDQFQELGSSPLLETAYWYVAYQLASVLIGAPSKSGQQAGEVGKWTNT